MSLYHESQVAIDEAEMSARAGDSVAASAAYRRAAELQRRFVESLPASRVKTRATFSLSVATLLHRAGAVEEARRYATEVLVKEVLDERTKNALKALL